MVVGGGGSMFEAGEFADGGHLEGSLCTWEWAAVLAPPLMSGPCGALGYEQLSRLAGLRPNSSVLKLEGSPKIRAVISMTFANINEIYMYCNCPMREGVSIVRLTQS